jgi:hypothetical protein
MESSRIISLFGKEPLPRRRPSAFVVSMVTHVLLTGLLYLHLSHAVRVVDEAAIRRYTVRLLALQKPEPKRRRLLEPKSAEAAKAAGEVASGGQPAAPALPLEIKNQIPAPQTLIQPNLPPNLLAQAMPTPLVLMWSPDNLAVKIVPPVPQVHAADVHPDLEAPNRESQLANLQISESVFVTDKPFPPPSTTSPVAVRGPEAASQVPQTTSQATVSPTPATVLSLSDLRMDQGTLALPAVNETAAVGASDALAPAREVNSNQEGNGNTASKQNGVGAGTTPGTEPGKGAGGESADGQAGAKQGGDTGGSQGTGEGLGGRPTVTQIVVPKDGKFGVVVVGASMAERYPEAAGLWGSRMAYTVYLHVGSSKSWILQYSLPAAADKGTVARIDAPWPYVMERPELSPGDLDGDAILVHGFINSFGRFEKLAIVFPVGFAQTKFVLDALDQWQFRAALQNGLITTVEVLLIIPTEAE